MTRNRISSSRSRPSSDRHSLLVRIALLICLTLTALPAAAQDVAVPLRSPILTIERERLFAESRTGQAILKALEVDTAKLAAENRRIEAELTDEERSLTEQRPTLPADEFRALAEAFDAKVVAIRREQDAKARALTQRRESDQQDFFRKAMPIVAELVRARQAVVVLERGAVLLSAEQVDITDAAIALIDARLAGVDQGEGATEDEGAPMPQGDGALPD
ncbi:Outer membrane protein H precursor [Rhodovulum sp. P5]|uniref:OmpH family outer membrane protein n=1 Tax=Rhodovulum sp. P5 TaxID=1564506 RepID=UPI0009C1FF65|nr:OmpH family outer membrane protein [Rhodovulum sp. P5]ARE38298.1 Outer membrane protein H precursor [Rhodovulum sp. P5]